MLNKIRCHLEYEYEENIKYNIKKYEYNFFFNIKMFVDQSRSQSRTFSKNIILTAFFTHDSL